MNETPLNLINLISGNYYNKLERLIAPLKAYGITYFCWQTVSNDGLWSIIGNRPDWLEHSAGNNYYLYVPTLVSPEYYNNAIHYAITHEEEHFNNTIARDSLQKFDINYPLVIIEKT